MRPLHWGYLIFLLVACDGSGSPATRAAQTACSTAAGSSTTSSNNPQPLQAALQAEVAFPNLAFTSPVFVTHAGDGSNRLFVVEQAGRILVFRNDPMVMTAATFLDISARVRSGGELGLLGLAFDPDFVNNGFFYVNYTIDNPPPLRTRISRFQVDAVNPNAANGASESILLEFDQPFENHNGGMLAFGPNDGKLYIATGDGGSGNDPQNNAQNLNTLLGKILRINPDGAIPTDNPCLGITAARGEIWAYGLRNPWRMSFDRATGQLWAGDVGQGAREEIDIIARGGNYGWPIYEGTRSNKNPGGLPLSDFTAPIYEYDHTLGQSITGGYVYRGPGLPAFNGVYFYADFVSGRVWGLVYRNGAVASNTQVATLPNPSSFGEDEAGELYVTSFDGNVYRFRPM